VVLGLVDMVETRIELLLVEVQEERERLFPAVVIALGIATFGLLTGVALTFGIVVAFWERSPYLGLIVLAPVYGITTAWLVYRLKRLKTEWHSFSATIEQLRKDCRCLASDLP
jgi:uncharacterized membrane protein YqjE